MSTSRGNYSYPKGKKQLLTLVWRKACSGKFGFRTSNKKAVASRIIFLCEQKDLGMQPNSIANTKKTKGTLLANRTDKYGYLKEKISNSIIIYWTTTFHLWHHESKVHSSLVNRTQTVRQWFIRLMKPTTKYQMSNKWPILFKQISHLWIRTQNGLEKEEIIWSVPNLEPSCRSTTKFKAQLRYSR